MNKQQLGRLCLLCLAAGIITWLALGPQDAWAQFDSPLATPTPAPSQETPVVEVIDLSVDENHDGMPDQLQAALEQFNAAYEAAIENGGDDPFNNPEVLAALQKAQDDFARQLPYSDQTRAVQARLAELYDALSTAPDQETREELWDEIGAAEAQMQADPNFALIDHLLSRRLLDALNAKVEEGQDETGEATATPQPPTPTVIPTPEPTQVPALPAGEMEAASMVVAAAPNQGGLLARLSIAWTRIFQRDACTSNLPPDLNLLVRGEIMFLGQDQAAPNFFYAKKFNHTAIYDGIVGGFRQVYEAWPDVGVVRRQLAVVWQVGGSCVAFARINGTSPLQRQTALDAAHGVYGINSATPYNFNFIDKNINTALYCSQLVWKTFQHNSTNKNLDSNSAVYRDWLVARFAFTPILGATASAAAGLMVAPDEIALHSDVAIYHERQNP